MHNDKPGNPDRWQDRIDDVAEPAVTGWNKAAAWQQLSQQLHPGDRKRRLVVLPRRWVAAAALLLAIGAATTWYLLPKPQPEPIQPLVKTAHPSGVEQPFVVKPGDSSLPARAEAVQAIAARPKKTIARTQEKEFPVVMPHRATEPATEVQVDETALTRQFDNPLTPKKRKVFHQNNISTPAELLSIQPGREQRRMSLFRQPAEPVPQTATPLVIPLNN